MTKADCALVLGVSANKKKLNKKVLDEPQAGKEFVDQRYRISNRVSDLYRGCRSFRFPLSHELITLAGHDFSMARVADIDALFAQLLNQPSTHPDVTDERIPYWAEIWPAAIGLAEYLFLHPSLVMGKKVVEIGCGFDCPA